VEVEQVAFGLIPMLYDASAREGQMLAFTDALTAELGDFAAGVCLRMPGFGAPAVIHSSDDDPEAMREYTAHFHAVDPKIRSLTRATRYTLTETTSHLRPETFRRSEFYNDFLVPFKRAWGPHYGAVLATEQDRPVSTFFVRNRRSHSDAPLSKSGCRLVETLLPHVVSARRVWAALDAAVAREEGLRSALDCMEMGVVLVDGSQRISWASRVAETILVARDGLHLEAGELHADSRSEDSTLQKQISDAIRMGSGVGLAKGGVIPVSRPSGRRSLEVVVAPVGRDSSLLSVAPSGGALVFVLDPEVAMPDEYRVLRALYGFTPAEARFARLLANDLSLSEAAERAGITLQTARHRLKSLFEKTSTHRQSSLVRLLVRGPASLALRPDVAF